ncbi:sodium/calcium exchanger membrane region [Natronococcus jeotgali DSM 18795]|uniref:Sodium/calcium exchanger membrane region n=2 Tax=Natronococcus jeotgali TaxID=413812 RepID=L9XL36_9EURY|nr:sodium/calcium exchanger membrane region [Natronococcus jeotgali DSM 18795]
MIQWLAPLASESPELIVVAYLVNKARSTAGFNALISSKLNQWTLLIGTLAVVYSLSAGAIGTLPFDSKQAAEIWITAAQSFFAIALLIDFEISIREALALLLLFVTQVLAEFYVIRNYTEPAATTLSMEILYIYTAIYLVLGVGLFIPRRESLYRLIRRTVTTAQQALGTGPNPADSAD